MLSRVTIRSSQVAVRSLVIIDSSIDDYQSLVNGTIFGAEVIVLNPQQDGVTQISAALRHQHFENLHIVSHGSPGTLYLGNAQLSLSNLEQYAWELQSWSCAAILLYGCNVAAGDAGTEFVEKLHQLTGANIAASTTLTGHADLNGNWDLDVQVGNIALALPFTQEAVTQFRGILPQTGSPPTLAVSGSVFANGSTPRIVAEGLTITDPEAGDSLDGARVSIGNGFTTGDYLGIQGQGTATSGVIGAISWDYDAIAGLLTFTGDALISEYQAALRQVTYYSGGAVTNGSRSIDFSLGKNIAFTGEDGKGHFYEFVTAPDIDWTDAKTAAAGLSYFGLQGYLTVVTSTPENDFILSKLNGEGWLGASDDPSQGASEGEWFWVTGPEAGKKFFSANGNPLDISYDNWEIGEPNDAGGEHFAHFRPDGKWNDYANTTLVDGYVVEYGGLNTDPTVTLTGSVELTVLEAPSDPTVEPDLDAASDTGTSDTDNITSDTTPTFVGAPGNGTPGDTVTLYEDTTVLGTGTVANDGSWLITASTLGAGSHSIFYTFANAPGNESQPSPALTITIDAPPPEVPPNDTPPVPASPSAPSLTSESDSGASPNDGITNNSTPTFTGTAATGSTVELFVGTTSLGSAQVDAQGNWSFTPITPLADGIYNISIQITDSAGNRGLVSEPVTLVIDTQKATGVMLTLDPKVRDTTVNKDIDGITIQFSEAVAGFDLADLKLSFNGKPTALTGAVLTSSDNKRWTLSNFTSLTALEGEYKLEIVGNDITDLAGNATVVEQSTTEWLLGRTGVALAAIQAKGGKRGFKRRGGKQGDEIQGSFNNDVLIGGAGNDRISSGFGKARFGRDVLIGGAGNDRLFAGGGRDILKCGAGNDVAFGGTKDDQLLGGTGDDRLVGQAGNDVLVGGAGNDTLIGGADRDTFVFNSLSEGIDTIVDFSNNDLIDLRKIFANPEFSGSSPFAQFEQFVKLAQVGSDVEVRIDADGSGSGTEFVTLTKLQNVAVSAVNSTNFVFA